MPLRATTTKGSRRISVIEERAEVESLPAPTGGWNARDPLESMKPADAVILDNWFPRTSDVKLRKGYASHATGLGAAVESLMTWAGPASSKMFGAAGANVYEVTSAGAVGAAEFGSMTNARWQHVMFGNSAGAYLYIVNGADAPRYYDGTSWTVPTITGSGLTESNLVNVTHFNSRLYFCENDKLGFWYFPVEAISGSISYFDLAPLCKKGGHLVAMGTITHDGGQGIDDYLVCITSKGEAVVFRGTNPGDSNSWVKVGVFIIGPPIGRRCLTQLGSDLVVITKDGFAPLGQFLRFGRVSEEVAISDKIRGAVDDMVADHGAKFGWQPIFYPAGNYVLFNIPIIENTTMYQFVSNTTTGAWCRFRNQDANCWELLNDELYFGGSQTVFKADTGQDDNSGDIETDAQTAFNYLKRRGILKNFNMARSIVATDGTLNLAIEAMVDYESRLPVAAPSFAPSTGSPWDTSPWDTSPWSGAEEIKKDWQTITGIGYAVSLRVKTTSQGGSIRWISNDILFERGGLV